MSFTFKTLIQSSVSVEIENILYTIFLIYLYCTGNSAIRYKNNSIPIPLPIHKITNYTQGICCDRTGDKGWVLLRRLYQSQKWGGYTFCKLVTVPIKGKITTYTANGYRSLLFYYLQFSLNFPAKFMCILVSLNSGRHGHMPAVSMKGARREGGGLWAVDLPDMAACLGVIGCRQGLPAIVSNCKNWYYGNQIRHNLNNFLSAEENDKKKFRIEIWGTYSGLQLFFRWTKKIEKAECVHHERYQLVSEVILSKLLLEFSPYLGACHYSCEPNRYVNYTAGTLGCNFFSSGQKKLKMMNVYIIKAIYR